MDREVRKLRDIEVVRTSATLQPAVLISPGIQEVRELSRRLKVLWMVQIDPVTEELQGRTFEIDSICIDCHNQYAVQPPKVRVSPETVTPERVTVVGEVGIARRRFAVVALFAEQLQECAAVALAPMVIVAEQAPVVVTVKEPPVEPPVTAEAPQPETVATAPATWIGPDHLPSKETPES